MRHLLQMTRREMRFAAAGIVITLLVGVPVVAVASPGAIPGTGPGEAVDPGTEQALDVNRGDSCRNMLPADTPKHVVCRWLTPPQDAAEVAAFWAADDGANLEAAQPLPAQYDLSLRLVSPSTRDQPGACQWWCSTQPRPRGTSVPLGRCNPSELGKLKRMYFMTASLPTGRPGGPRW